MTDGAKRPLWVLGNWKQNLLRGPASELATAVASGLEAAVGRSGVHVGIAPSYLAIEAVRPQVAPNGGLKLLCQDIAAQESGAFTGEVGPAMARDAGVHAAIIGHSERRASFGDSDDTVAAKVSAALAGGLEVVLCVGESLEQRDSGDHETVVISQLSRGLSQVDLKVCADRIVIAYEPVWAIGTGRTASPEQAAQMHTALRAWLRETYGALGADRSILYGGSVKPGNAASLLEAPDVDGFLVGGASLQAESFLAIAQAAAESLR